MKLIQLFNWLDIPRELGEDSTLLISGNEGASNDSYHRWYPSKAEDPEEVGKWCFFKSKEDQETGKLLNKWLIENGMKWDKEDKCFHVLIHISW